MSNCKSENMSVHMAEINIPGRLLKDIKQSAINHNLTKIILFGSRARGTHQQRSDVDLAIEGDDFDGFYSDMQNHAHSLLSLDIVKYDNSASEDLRKEIERDGVIIYEKN